MTSYYFRCFCIAFLFACCNVTKSIHYSCCSGKDVEYSVFCTKQEEDFKTFVSRVKHTEGVNKIDINSSGIVTLILEQAFFDDKVNLGWNFTFLIYNDIYKSFFRFRMVKGILVISNNSPRTLLPITGDYEIRAENNILYKKLYYDCMNLSKFSSEIDSLLYQSNTNEIPNERLEYWRNLH